MRGRNLPRAHTPPPRHFGLWAPAAPAPSGQRKDLPAAEVASCPAVVARNSKEPALASVPSEHPAYALLFEQRIHKFFRVKGQQIAHLLAHTDKPDGQAEFARDGDHHAALRSAIELGENDPRDAR